MCIFVCFYNISACYQVGLSSPSIIKLDLSSKNYVSVENMCMHLCALGMCEFVHVITLMVRRSFQDVHQTRPMGCFLTTSSYCTVR